MSDSFPRNKNSFVKKAISLEFYNLTHEEATFLYLISEHEISDKSINELVEKFDINFVDEILNHRDIKYKSVEDFAEYALKESRRIRGLSPEDLRSLYHSLLIEEAEFVSAQNINADRWAFFNRPAAITVNPTWLTTPLLTGEEAVALSLGKEPAVVNLKSLTAKVVRRSPFKSEFNHRIRLVQRAQADGSLPKHFSPSKFNEWAMETKAGFLIPGIQTKLDEKIDSDKCQILSDEINKLKHRIRCLETNIHEYNRKSVISLCKILNGLIKHKFPNSKSIKLATEVHTAVSLSIEDPPSRETVGKWINIVQDVSNGVYDELRPQIKSNGLDKIE